MYKVSPPFNFFLGFILMTHEGSHSGWLQGFQPSLTSSACGAKGYLGKRFRAPPAYTAQLSTLHQDRANNPASILVLVFFFALKQETKETKTTAV